MPEGQIIFRTNVTALNIRTQSSLTPKSARLTAAASRMSNAKLLAQNTLLQSALERQRTKAADLRSILCSMDMATICVCPALELRLFTAAAGHLLGIGAEQVGLTLSLCGPFGLDGTLMARMRAVLDSGVADQQVIALASGQQLLCRLLPLHAFDANGPAMEGVIITYATGSIAAVEVPITGQPDHKQRSDDARQTAIYPDVSCSLTRRQHQVLGHVLAGHPSKNIAADLGISRRTVENHRAAIMARTGATSIPALARIAIGADVGGDCKAALSRHAPV